MSERDKTSRRVYARELKQRLGIGDTWLRTLENTGRIPPGRKDEGGKRKFWFDDEVEGFMTNLANRTTAGSKLPPRPPKSAPEKYKAANITTRDYFAAHAPPYPFALKITPDGDITATVATRDARWRYAHADAMLAERAK